MQHLTVIIEKAEANYSAYIDEIGGIAVTGYTLTEIREKMKDAIEFYVETCRDIGCEMPEQLSSEYELSFEMDAETCFTYFDGILGKPALEKITGVNQKQLWHYASGLTRPRPKQREKILNGLHRLGEELQLITLK